MYCKGKSHMMMICIDSDCGCLWKHPNWRHHFVFQKSDSNTFEGFIRVHMNLIRPINMSLSARPPSIYEVCGSCNVTSWNSATCPDSSDHHYMRILSTLKALSLQLMHWDRILMVQWEGMGDVGSARYEPALLRPFPTIRVSSYNNSQRSTHSISEWTFRNLAL